MHTHVPGPRLDTVCGNEELVLLQARKSPTEGFRDTHE